MLAALTPVDDGYRARAEGFRARVAKFLAEVPTLRATVEDLAREHTETLQGYLRDLQDPRLAAYPSTRVEAERCSSAAATALDTLDTRPKMLRDVESIAAAVTGQEDDETLRSREQALALLIVRIRDGLVCIREKAEAAAGHYRKVFAELGPSVVLPLGAPTSPPGEPRPPSHATTAFAR